ncbi:hypothetical protein RIF29_39082 [Crotalaria pallida]|uniref:Uncharacterized protein n=1 Tax=Crotalaria pallida TaxID=3830 RepID=A0AAN9HSZ3_CROPI
MLLGVDVVLELAWIGILLEINIALAGRDLLKGVLFHRCLRPTTAVHHCLRPTAGVHHCLRSTAAVHRCLHPSTPTSPPLSSTFTFAGIGIGTDTGISYPPLVSSPFTIFVVLLPLLPLFKISIPILSLSST